MPEVTRVPRARIIELVKLQHGVAFIPIHFANLELSARAPYNAALGRIDVTNAFWNTTTNAIDLQPKFPSSPSDNDVSLVSGVFLPPTTGQHLVAVHFTGVDIRMDLNGPWGTTSAMSNGAQQTAVALLNATAGVHVDFFCTAHATSNNAGLASLGLIEVFN